MAAVGGSIQEVALSGRVFAVAADAEAQRKLGGYENEVQPNGDGMTARLIKTRVAWMIDGLSLEMDDSRGDHEFLQNLTNENEYFPVSITYASGETYSGTGQVTGETQTSSQSAMASVSLMGAGILSRQ